MDNKKSLKDWAKPTMKVYSADIIKGSNFPDRKDEPTGAYKAGS